MEGVVEVAIAQHQIATEPPSLVPSHDSDTNEAVTN